MKNGPSIPGWAVGLVLAVFAVAIIGFGYKYVMGAGPVDPSSLTPKERENPYTNSEALMKSVGNRASGGSPERR